jgi:hypothetical protein
MAFQNQSRSQRGNLELSTISGQAVGFALILVNLLTSIERVLIAAATNITTDVDVDVENAACL